jgi:hypothetical protein
MLINIFIVEIFFAINLLEAVFVNFSKIKGEFSGDVYT